MATICAHENGAPTALVARFNNLFDEAGQLKSDYHAIQHLHFNGIFVTDALFDKLIDALKSAQPETINFAYNKALPPSPNRGLFLRLAVKHYNLEDKYLARFVNAVLTNTNLIACNLATSTANQLLVSLLDLVIQRNKAMRANTSYLAKRKIYNDYVKIINTQINNIHINNVINKEDLVPMDSVVPLVQQCAFFAANMMSLSAEQKQSLPQELLEFIEDYSVNTNKKAATK